MYESILSSAFTAAMVSGIVSFIAKEIISRKISHQYQKDTERLKAELAIEIEIYRSIFARKLNEYAQIVELVYRTKNIVRDIAPISSARAPSMLVELNFRRKEIEKLLYHYRIDLVKDVLFDNVHEYKNVVGNYCMRYSDMDYFSRNDELERSNSAAKDLCRIQNDIEHLYEVTIQQFSKSDEDITRKHDFRTNQTS